MTNRPDQTTYRILIKGRLGPRWVEWFEGMAITVDEGGNTVLTGPVVDQSALQGILSRIGFLNMTLISVTQMQTDPCAVTSSDSDLDHHAVGHEATE